MKNPMLDAIRETRERLLEESGGTLEGLVRKLQAEEKTSGRAILRSPAKAALPGVSKSTEAAPKTHLPPSEFVDHSVPKPS